MSLSRHHDGNDSFEKERLYKCMGFLLDAFYPKTELDVLHTEIGKFVRDEVFSPCEDQVRTGLEET